MIYEPSVREVCAEHDKLMAEAAAEAAAPLQRRTNPSGLVFKDKQDARVSPPPPPVEPAPPPRASEDDLTLALGKVIALERQARRRELEQEVAKLRLEISELRGSLATLLALQRGATQ